MTEADRLFIDLRPPPGGLSRLQRSIAARARPARTAPWRLAGAGTLAVAVLALAWLLPGTLARHRQTARIAAALQAAVAPPIHGIHVGDGAALELPSGRPDVRIYLVASAPLPPARR